jgi:arginase
VDMGPSALRVAGLGRRLNQLGFTVVDHGNIDIAQAESLPKVCRTPDPRRRVSCPRSRRPARI